jgi:hypothetical protein
MSISQYPIATTGITRSSCFSGSLSNAPSPTALVGVCSFFDRSFGIPAAGLHQQLPISKESALKPSKGAHLDRYVTDEQRSSRPVFNATLRAAASWLFFRVARSTRMTQIWALRSRKKQPTDLRRNSRDLGDGALFRRLPGRNVSFSNSNRFY